MNQYVKRIQRDCSLSFKLTAVERVEKGEMTHRQAQDCPELVERVKGY